jgi:hypothetical protein
MGFDYRFEDDLVRITAHGSFDLEMIESTFREIAERYPAGKNLRVLIEDRSSPFNPSEDDVKAFLAVWEEIAEARPTRIALQVERELHFGIGQMIQLLAEGTELDFRVFRERREAMVWLRRNGSGEDEPPAGS